MLLNNDFKIKEYVSEKYYKLLSSLVLLQCYCDTNTCWIDPWFSLPCVDQHVGTA